MKTHGHSVLPFFALPSAEDEVALPGDLLRAKAVAEESFSSIMQRTGMTTQDSANEKVVLTDARLSEADPAPKFTREPGNAQLAAPLHSFDSAPSIDLAAMAPEPITVTKQVMVTIQEKKSDAPSTSEKPAKAQAKVSPLCKPVSVKTCVGISPGQSLPSVKTEAAPISARPKLAAEKKPTDPAAAVVTPANVTEKSLPEASPVPLTIAKSKSAPLENSASSNPASDQTAVTPAETRPLTSVKEMEISLSATAAENAVTPLPDIFLFPVATPKSKSVAQKSSSFDSSVSTQAPVSSVLTEKRQTTPNISNPQAKPAEEAISAKAKENLSTNTVPDNKSDPKQAQFVLTQTTDKSSTAAKITAPPEVAAVESQAAADFPILPGVTVIEARGTVGALNDRRMKPMLERDEIAGNKVEPSPRAVAAAGSANKSGTDADSSSNSNFSSTKPETGNELLAGELAAKTTWTAPAETVQGQSAPVTSSASQAERVGSFVNQHVVSLRQSGAATLSVSLRLDAQTNLNLHLTTHKGQVEAFLQWDRGANPGLESHWKDLQQSLAKQNVQLLPFEAKPAAKVVTANTTSASSAAVLDQNSQPRQRRQRETQADGVETFFIGNSSAVKQTSSRTFSGQGWESWA